MKEKGLEGMIERAEGMIPRKENILSPDTAWKRTPEQTKKIMGMQPGEAIPNKYLKRFKEITKGI